MHSKVALAAGSSAEGGETMSDSRPIASLSSALLARKGEAKPAMRRQAIQLPMGHPANPIDDLGWNDMGHDPAQAETIALPGVEALPEAEAPPVHEQFAALEREFAMPAASSAPIIRAAPGSKAKAAFTLRLDPQRHLKLRMLCALRHRSAQHIVTEALDAFLNTQPEINDPAFSAGR
jgi:hypothetical protein